MNRVEIGKLLTIASGFDRRQVDEMTVEAWHSVPEVREASFEDARRLLVAHVSGPRHAEYFTVGVLSEQLRAEARAARGDVEADVRVAKALGLVPETHPRRAALPEDAAQRLAEYRERVRDEVRRYAEPEAIEA